MKYITLCFASIHSFFSSFYLQFCYARVVEPKERIEMKFEEWNEKNGRMNQSLIEEWNEKLNNEMSLLENYCEVCLYMILDLTEWKLC